MILQNRTVLVTGANRGLGRALVEEALDRNVGRVYAGTRRPFDHADPRVVPVPLDVTDRAQIEAAVAHIGTLDVLVNNAGIGRYAGLADRAALEDHLAVNLFGMYDVTHAFIPHLIASGGALVNVLSVAALAPVPTDPTYGISKAAAHAFTQSVRAVLAPQGVSVHAVLAGPVDTAMGPRGIPKTAPEAVAHAIWDAVEGGADDIFPDPFSAAIADDWATGVAKTLERQFAALVVSRAAPATR